MAESVPVPATPNPAGPSHPTPVETELAPGGLNGSSALLARTPLPAPPAEQPVPAESPAPAELVPAPTLRERLAWYVGAAALYAFLPYHYMRGENHYFLSAYWLVPLSLLPMFALLKGELPFFRKEPGGRLAFRPLTRDGLLLVLLGAATASGGAYYAFFACALYAAAGLYGWVYHRTWRVAASAGLLVGVVFAFGVVNHLPTIVYQARWGRNAVTDRIPEEAEIYGLKFTHLVLPI